MNAALLHADLPAPVPPGAVTDPRVVPRRMVELSGDRRLACIQAGAGPDLVAIHGTLMTLEEMQLGPMPALAQHFRVTAVDRPGHGYSERHRLVDASIRSQAALIREGVRALGLRRPVLVGHSFGGAVALAYAMRHPDEVAGVVALAPVCFPEPRLEQVLFGPRAVPVLGEALSEACSETSDPAVLPALWWATFAPQPMTPAFATQFPFELVRRPAQLIAEGEDANALWTGLTWNALGYAGCRVPVRILAGGSDLVVAPTRHGAAAARLIPGARFERLPGLGHMFHHYAVGQVVAAARAVAEAGRPG